MVLETADHRGEPCDKAAVLAIDLGTGARRTWTLPYADGGGDGYDEYFVQGLAWSPDNRHIALVYGQCCSGPYLGRSWILDTHRPAGRLLANLRTLRIRGSCPASVGAWTTAGLIGLDTPRRCRAPFSILVTVNRHSGATRPLSTARLPAGESTAIVPDASGSRWLVAIGGSWYRIDRATVTSLRWLRSASQLAW